MEEFTPTLLFALTRFGRWQDALDLPEPPSELLYTRATWHYSRGLSLVRLDRLEQAALELEKLAESVKTMPEDRTIGVESVAALAKIAQDVLAGELAARRGQAREAVSLLRRAVAREDGLRYYEPPLWHYPVRHSLGAVLLAAHRSEEAEQVYREDLVRHPENGWALYGLAESLRAQGQRDAAAAVEQRFQKAWSRADVRLTASRF